MSISTDKARIKWNCRRGMLELDLLLQPFIADGLDTLSNKQCILLEKLLAFPDPVLYSWLMNHDQPKDIELLEIVLIIRTYS